MKHYLAILILSLLLLVACDPAAELGTPFRQGQEVTLTAAIAVPAPQMLPGKTSKQAPMQRISGKDAPTTIDLVWDEGDEIRVHVGEASSVFRLVAGAGTSQASFVGTMPASGSSYEVTYPKENSDDLLLQQTYVPDGIAKGLMKMSTPSPGTIDKGFTLQAEHAVLGLQLTGNSEIGKIVLTRNAEKGATSVESYTLNCTSIVHGKLSNSTFSGVTLTETATLFYIVLPAGIWANGFTVEVYDADNTTVIDSFVTTKSFTFEAANATTMAEKEVQHHSKRIGVFSVAKNKHVSFSKGNLQYIQSANLWQFANEQYESIGAANIKDGKLADRIDLFGWSADNTTAPFGVSTSMSTADYAGEFVDWGVNTISGDAPGIWRTLTKEEFDYLMNKRLNAASRLAIAQVNGVNGIILLPDIWQITDEVELKTGLYSTCVADYSVHQSVSEAEWKILENAGAVFLPASGRRSGSKIIDLYQGIYWTSTIKNNSPYNIHFQTDKIRIHWEEDTELYARSVRLVHDTILPPALDQNISFEVNDVQYKMIYVDGGTFMMGSADDDEIVNQNLAAKGDELPQHKVTLDSYYIGEIEVTQKLWKDIMGTDVYDLYRNLTHHGGPEPKVVGDNYPIYYMYTSDMVEFTRKLSKVTGLNFRLPTEAEWEYAARGGNKSKGYLYAGSNNVDDVAWYSGNTKNMGAQLVAQKLPNELGIYDMSGNVLERCLDFLEYHEQYAPEDVTNPRGRYIRQAGNRAYRGGSCTMHKDSARVTHRAPQTPTYTSTNVGARLVINDNHHFQTFCVNNVWFDMIFVKGGSFQMGCTTEMDTDAYAHEAPVHSVTLSDYYIGQIEVTQALWNTVMGTNPSTIKDNNRPVNNVSWEDCQVFIEKLNKKTGYSFRLPTEAEWEYAARGGHKSRAYKYAGSDNIDEVAWYKDNSGGKYQPFALKKPNELGIYDMSGNVFEWCQDWYGPYSADAQVNPQGPESGPYHMIRGGGWKHTKSNRVTYRRTTGANLDITSIGLRLVLEVQK